MQRTALKNQVALFGSFSFPAVPDTTIKLLNAFATLGFLPQIVTSVDPTNGLSAQKISLVRGTDQIHFGNDRIDVFSFLPSSENLNSFLSEVVTYVQRLDSSLTFTRLGLVHEIDVQAETPEKTLAVRRKLLPESGEDSIEWTARWVNPVTVDGMDYNLCFEAMLAPGLAMVVNNKVTPINGIKVMHDVSTLQNAPGARYDSKNLAEALAAMAAIVERQKLSFQF
ncbi:hypothetical protein B0920_19980 [Massilia sp. KIM]|uniref:hypothetical protein n=1 Tax=Massilia sp. KIM TaxID=1955422 RepID=UPI00098FE3D4|nr:hypothetical protein [Massilia sp. KIM]OON61194.1 hypothetical protein B0920_19980 [Massilia sp. KIM]